jgi:hypothetical protein
MIQTRMSPAEIALRNWVNKNSGRKPGLAADLASNELRIEDHTLYVRKQISGSGIQELITIATAEARGAINLDKGKFTENEVFAFDRVGIKFADATGSDPAAVKTYSPDGQQMPAALKNGELVLSQNEGEIFHVAVDDCVTDVDSEFANGRGNTKELSVPVVVEDNKVIKLTLENAEGLSFTTGVSNNAFVEIKFYGVKIKQKARG